MIINSKYKSRCTKCGEPIPQFTDIEYVDKKAYHVTCFVQQSEPREPTGDLFTLTDTLAFLPSSEVENSLDWIRENWVNRRA